MEMPFGIWARVGRRKHVLDGGAHWRRLANAIEPSTCGGDAAFCGVTRGSARSSHKGEPSGRVPTLLEEKNSRSFPVQFQNFPGAFGHSYLL